MQKISIDVDSTLENKLRELLRDLQKTAPGISLRSLRSALWRMGMLQERSVILAACLSEGRPHGSAARASVPLTPVRQGRPSGIPDAARDYLRSQGLTLASHQTEAQAREYNRLCGTDRANAQIAPKRRPFNILKKRTK